MYQFWSCIEIHTRGKSCYHGSRLAPLSGCIPVFEVCATGSTEQRLSRVPCMLADARLVFSFKVQGVAARSLFCDTRCHNIVHVYSNQVMLCQSYCLVSPAQKRVYECWKYSSVLFVGCTPHVAYRVLCCKNTSSGDGCIPTQ